jgi:hypothetical protein
VYHIGFNQEMQHRPFPENLRWLIQNFGLGSNKYQHVNIALLNNSFSILPEAFAGKEGSKSMLEFSSGQSVRHNYSNSFNNLSFNYELEQETLSVLEKSFRNANIRHGGAVTVNLLFNNRSLKKSQVLLNFNDGLFELAARNDNNLLYYNVFGYETKDDVLYYLLFMMEQFNLDPGIARVAMAGQIEAGSELHRAITKYIRFTNFAVNDLPVSADPGFPDHYYFTLLNQHLCEL